LSQTTRKGKKRRMVRLSPFRPPRMVLVEEPPEEGIARRWAEVSKHLTPEERRLVGFVLDGLTLETYLLAQELGMEHYKLSRKKCLSREESWIQADRVRNVAALFIVEKACRRLRSKIFRRD